mgnify:CR=1 FL=1
MNYYERHLGDYAKDTAHLSMIEHGAYGLLLDRYYATESGIPAAQAHRLARARTEDERNAVDAVLDEFFVLIDGVWINHRAEEEIKKASARIKAAQENGKKGGRPKKETEEKPSGFSLGSFSETQAKAHQTPCTSLLIPDGISSALTADDEPQRKTSGTPKRATQLPEDFYPDGTALSLAAELGVSLSAELPKFRDYHTARGKPMKDWQAALRTWLRNAKQFAKPAAKQTESERRAAWLADITGRNGDAIDAPARILG